MARALQNRFPPTYYIQPKTMEKLLRKPKQPKRMPGAPCTHGRARLQERRSYAGEAAAKLRGTWQASRVRLLWTMQSGSSTKKKGGREVGQRAPTHSQARTVSPEHKAHNNDNPSDIHILALHTADKD